MQPFRSPPAPVFCLPAFSAKFAGPLCFVIRVRTGFIRKLMIAAVTLMIAAIWASSFTAAISAGVSHISGPTVSYSPPENDGSMSRIPLPLVIRGGKGRWTLRKYDEGTGAASPANRTVSPCRGHKRTHRRLAAYFYARPPPVPGRECTARPPEAFFGKKSGWRLYLFPNKRSPFTPAPSVFKHKRREAPAQVISRARVIVNILSSISPQPRPGLRPGHPNPSSVTGRGFRPLFPRTSGAGEGENGRTQLNPSTFVFVVLASYHSML
jgi:hypothetical protein